MRSTREDGLELGTIALGALLRPTQELPETVVQFAATRPQLNIKLYRNSIITAGVCIYADSDQGRLEFAAWEQKIVDRSALFFRRLASPQLRFESAQSIARQCASLKMTYYTRCLQPADSLALATKFDDKLTELLQQRVGVTDQLLQKEQWIRALFFLPLRHGGAGLTSAVNTRHAAFLAAVLNGLDPLQQLGVDASGLKAQAIQALEKCIQQATKNSQLSELLLKASGTDDPITTLLNELRSKDGSFVEARGFQKRLCAAIAKQDRDDMTQTLNSSQQVRLISGLQQWVALPFALPAARRDLLLTDDECKVAWRLRLLLSPVQTLPTRYVCNQPNPFAKDPERSFKCPALRKISMFRRQCGSSSRSYISTAALWSTHRRRPVKSAARRRLRGDSHAVGGEVL